MKDNKWTKEVKEYFIKLRKKGHEVKFWFQTHYWEYGTAWIEPEPEEYDWIISYLSPHILTMEEIKMGTKGAINFHPGPPEYPGIGCYNFAIYNGATEYGVTCHFMDVKVDTGPIIDYIYFFIPRDITVYELQWLSMIHLQSLFYKIMINILENHPLLESKMGWKRKPYTRKDLQNLILQGTLMIRYDNIIEKLEKWLQATYYPNAQDPPYIEINGKKWRLEPL